MTSKQFKSLREKLFRSQAAAAKAMGVGRSTVSEWEAGNNPISKMAEILLRHLVKEKVSPDLLAALESAVSRFEDLAAVINEHGPYADTGFLRATARRYKEVIAKTKGGGS